MNNHLNMLPKQTKFDLKCSKVRWGAYDASPDPLVGRGFPPSALASALSPSCDSLSPPWLKSWLRAWERRKLKRKFQPHSYHPKHQHASKFVCVQLRNVLFLRAVDDEVRSESRDCLLVTKT